MSWQPFRSRLRMKTDMHCGTLMLGFVARAFPYVPQHVPIFAAVPAAVEALALPQVPTSYREMESLLLHGMRGCAQVLIDGKDTATAFRQSGCRIVQGIINPGAHIASHTLYFVGRKERIFHVRLQRVTDHQGKGLHAGKDQVSDGQPPGSLCAAGLWQGDSLGCRARHAQGQLGLYPAGCGALWPGHPGRAIGLRANGIGLDRIV